MAPLDRCFIPFLMIAIASATLSLAQDEGASIEGRLTDAISGTPVRRGLVTLRPIRNVTKTYTTASSADGSFAFSGVETGSYRIFLEKPGYLSQEYGSKTFQFGGEAVAVVAGDKKTGIEFKAMPQSVLTGKVIDEDGEPVPQSSVVATLRTKWNRQAGGRNGNTNDIGEFRIAGLTPGRYVLVANAFNRQMQVAVSNRPRTVMIDGVPRQIGYKTQSQLKQEEDYSPTYFPSVTEETAASVIELGPGQQIDNLVIRMRKTPVYSIRGTVKYSGSTPVGENGAQVQLIPKDAMRQGRGFGARQANAAVMKDSSFEFSGIAPGSYLLGALRNDLGQFPLGLMPVEVNGNLENITLGYGDPSHLIASAVWEDTAEIGLITGYLMLSEKNLGNAATPTLQLKDGKTEKPVNLPSGSYAVRFQSSTPGAYVKKITDKGGVDLGLIITVPEAATFEIAVVVSTKTATLEGTVTSDAKGPKTVMLVPEPAGQNALVFMRSINTDASGRYKLERIVPGSYKLFAFAEEIPGSAFLNGDLAQLLGNKGISITLKESDNETKAVPITALE